jgi:transcription antitermination factor NusG
MGSRDLRDNTTWVVLELTPLGEMRAEEGTLPKLLRQTLRVESDFPVFIPCVTYNKGKERIVLNMMEGYAFIASGLTEGEYINLGHNCPYVHRAMFSVQNGIPIMNTIADPALEELRIGLKNMVAVELDVGMRVEVIEGPYSNMIGDILSMTPEVALVYIKLRSLRAIRSIPRVVLRPYEPKTRDEGDGDGG